jgi:hypothetical protein
MAWLESLARRQGANPDELTTAANLDIPMPPADVQVSGPGYTPYDTGSSKPAPEPAKPPVVQAAPEPAADDPFGGMDPMAWLESLAKRQGADPSELTTAANIEIPIPPSDARETGPGYTPGYDAGPSKPPVTAQPPTSKVGPPPAPETIRLDALQPPPTVPTPKVAPPPLEEARQPAATTEVSDDPLGGMDPMAWLESLAKRQGANADELTTAADLEIPVPSSDQAVTGPGYTPGYDMGPGTAGKQPATAITQPSSVPPLPVRTPAKETPTPDEVPVAASGLDAGTPPAEPEGEGLIDGMDPLAWLEALALRNGAKKEELVTGGTAIVPPAPTSGIVNEPGYSDYSPFGNPPLTTELESPSIALPDAEQWFNQQAAPAEDAASVRPATPVSAASTPPDLFAVPLPQANPKVPDLPEFDIQDPIKWLESLSAFGTEKEKPSAVEDAFATFNGEPTGTLEANSTLDWLEELSLGSAPQPAQTEVYDDINAFFGAAVPEKVDDKGGLSNDPDELLAWLNKQTESLAEVHQVEDPDAVPEPASADASAELAPGELPEWLRGQIGVTATPEANALVSEVVEPPIPAEMPEWIFESVASKDNEHAVDLDVLLAQPTGATAEPQPEEGLLSTSEIAALTGPTTDEVDPWADALDEEFQRNKAGDVSIPDWYLEAIARNGEQIPEADGVPEPEAAAEFGGLFAEDAVVSGEPAVESIGIDDWIKELEAATLGETQSAAAPDAEAIPSDSIPEWIFAVAPGASGVQSPATATETPHDEDNLVDQWAEEAGSSEDLPDWIKTPLESAAPIAEVPVSPARPTGKIVLEPGITPVPPPTRTDIPLVRPGPAAAASVNPARSLASARELIGRNAHLESLTHLEPLIDGGHELDAVIGELGKVITAQPKSPRARRLLGDAFMRKGRLQDALDTYRSALDQL